MFRSMNEAAAAVHRPAPQPIYAEIAARLAGRLRDLKTPPRRVVALGHDDAALARILTQEFPGIEVTGVGEDQAMAGHGLAEGSYDAVVSNLLLPWAEDPVLLLHRAVRYLRPDGVLLAATLGPGSFKELAGGVAPLPHPLDVREAGGVLQRLKLALPVVDKDVLTLTFGDIATVRRSLAAHGWAPADPAATLAARADGKLPLTLEVVYLHAFKPAAGQPVAAARGSGRVSLVKILGPGLE
jgi:SAM-dependent methyltransferase